MAKVREAVKGKLIIKGYPTGSAHIGHFRHLANELKLKRNFKPTILIIDYINLCASSRLKRSAGSAETSYFIKSVAEEFRGFADELDVPLWTPTQFNREGYDNSDPNLTQVAESWGLPQTADFMCALIGGETLDKLKQRLVKQMKNRYADENENRKFVIGLDKPKMRFFNCEQAAQKGLEDSIEGESTDDRFRTTATIKRFGQGNKDKFADIKME
jgi:DnaB-like helicase C terminal domain